MNENYSLLIKDNRMRIIILFRDYDTIALLFLARRLVMTTTGIDLDSTKISQKLK